MPNDEPLNWCNNELHITGPNVPAVLRAVASDGTALDFNKIIPMPEELNGHSTWDEWFTANWGTTWNARGASVEKANQHYARLRFDSAWNPPEVLIHALSLLFSDHEFKVHTFDRLGDYQALLQYKAGVKLEHSVRDFGGPLDIMTNGNDARVRPFASADEMIAIHVAMFGDAGRFCVEAVLKYAPMFEGLDPLDFRVMLAPIEMGAYNRHVGYTITYRAEHAPRYILGNRKICTWTPDGYIAILGNHESMIDFLVHEMTHHRQAMHGVKCTRGTHRDRGWYAAIQEVAPRYLGVAFPESVWPKQTAGNGRLTEVEACHWPESFRALLARGDPRLSKCQS